MSKTRKHNIIKFAGALRLFRVASFVFSAVLLAVIGFNTYTRSTDRAFAAPSDTLNFQARLLSASGSIVPDGNYSITFNIYEDLVGGSSLWTETWNSGTAQVSVKAGYLSVYLGTHTSFPDLDWSDDKFLTMNVNGDGEMSPRLKLTAVPFAFSAEQLGSRTEDEFVQLNPGATPQVVNTTNSAIAVNQAGSGNVLQLQSGGSDVLVINNSGDATFSGDVSAVNGDFSGTLTVDDLATFSGGATIASGQQFTNAGSSLFTAIAISNISGGGVIGTAEATVDVASTFNINQTTAGQTLTLPTPTDTTAGRVVYINNVGSEAFAMYGVTISSARSQAYIWNGSNWVGTNIDGAGSGVTGVGSLDGAAKNASGATVAANLIYLQTADDTYAGLVSTAAQTFAGAKTFNGQIIASAGIDLGTEILQGTSATINFDNFDVDADGDVTLAGDLAVNGGNITSTGALNITSGGALVVGATGQTTTVRGSVTTITSNGAGNSIILNSADTIELQDDTNITGDLSISGTLGVTGLATFNGGLSVATGQQFTNAGSTLFSAIAITNRAAGGNIGTAAATVDVATTFNVSQTTAGQTLTLPAPTDATAGRVAFVNNTGSVSFTMYDSVIAAGQSNTFIWNGSNWVTTVSLSGSVVGAIGTIDSQTKSADGAVITGGALFMQTADGTHPGLVSTGAQTFAGAKTFNGQIVAGAGIDLGAQTLQGTTAVINFNNFDVDASGNVTLAGDLGAVNGTFSGDIGAVNATFSGDISAVDATLSGDLAVNGGDITSTGTLRLTTSNPNSIEFYTNSLGRWSILSGGEFQGNGASTIRTNTGNLTLTSMGGNGSVILTPNGAGTVSLDGNTAVSGSNTFTVGTGLTTLSGGLTATGTTSINTSGTANTAIGNATGTLTLTSSGLNVTSAGAVSGVTTLSTSGIITVGALGTADTDTVLCRNAAGQFASCSSTFATTDDLQGYVQLAPSTVQADSSANPSIHINDTGGGNLIHLLSGGNDRFVLQADGDVAINGYSGSAGFGIHNKEVEIVVSGSSAFRVGEFAGQPTFGVDTSNGEAYLTSRGADNGTNTRNSPVFKMQGSYYDGSTKWNNFTLQTLITGTTANDYHLRLSNTLGTEVMRIMGNGNVGIGTSGTPSQLLSVGGATGNFTVTSAGAVTAVGVNAGAGLLQGTGGLTITGTISINTTGTANTSIGNTTGTLSITSAGLNVSSAGAVSGVTTLETTGIVTVGTLGTANTDAVLCRNSSNQLAACSSTFLTSANSFMQGGNDFNATAVLGTTDADDLEIITNNQVRLTVQANGDVAFDTDTLFVDATNNRVGIGTSTPGYGLEVAAGDVKTSGIFVEHVTDFTPTAGNTGWYRIISTGSAFSSGIIRIVANYDNKPTELEFQYHVSGYGMPATITQTRQSAYNGSIVTQVRASNDGSNNAYLDIYVDSATAPDSIIVYGYGPQLVGFQHTPAYNPTVGSHGVKTLTLGQGVRSTDQVNVQGGIYSQADVGSDYVSKLINTGTGDGLSIETYNGAANVDVLKVVGDADGTPRTGLLVNGAGRVFVGGGAPNLSEDFNISRDGINYLQFSSCDDCGGSFINHNGSGQLFLNSDAGIRLVSQGTQVLNVTDSVYGHSVGIGTFEPGSKLVVKGNGNTNATSALNILNSDDDSLFFVRNDGNVGIGTATPTSAKLEVVGSTWFEGDSTISHSSSTALSVKDSNGDPVLIVNTLDMQVGIRTAPTNFTLQVQGDVGPDANNTYDIGSSAIRWKDIYLQGGLRMGTDGDDGTVSYDAHNDEFLFNQGAWFEGNIKIRGEGADYKLILTSDDASGSNDTELFTDDNVGFTIKTLTVSNDLLRLLNSVDDPLFVVKASGRVGIGTENATADLSFGGDSARTIKLETRTTNAAGNNLTVSAGNAGAGGSAFTGGNLVLQGGSAAGTGNANGGNVLLSGGAGVGTGVKGLVVIDTPTFATATQQNCATNCVVTQANVDNNAAVIVNTTNPGLDVSLPDPTNLTAGRVVYVTAANGSNDFTLVVNGGGGGNEIAMRANTTATMIWNGSDWTAAGASSSTTLQAAYTNTLTSAGGAEIVLNGPGGNADGLTIRNNPDNPIVGGILEVQSSIGTNLFSVNNLGTELAANGGAETSSSFSTNWSAAPAGGTVTRTTTNGQYVTGQAGVQVVTGSGANRGVRNNLSGNPATNTTYQVSFTGKLSSGTFTTLQVVYSRNGGTNTVACTNYSTQTLITTGWTKVTCTITTDGTAATNPDLIIRQTDSTSRTFWIDNLSFQRNDATTEPSHVQIGGGLNGGPITLFTLDRSSAPPVEDGNEAYLGSMYYDTTSGRIQCYEADGWGACGSAPNNFVNLTPEYAGAVLNGTGVGTLTADFCANEASVLEVNTAICDGTGNPGVVAGNYYRWTSPQATQQTYSIYVTYQLPAEFGQFSDNDTVRLTARTDHVSNGIVTYEMFRSEGGNLYACGSETTVTTSANTWQTVSINGDEATGCGFSAASADNNVIFKINVKANSNANVYVGNLSFTTLGQ